VGLLSLGARRPTRGCLRPRTGINEILSGAGPTGHHTVCFAWPVTTTLITNVMSRLTSMLLTDFRTASQPTVSRHLPARLHVRPQMRA